MSIQNLSKCWIRYSARFFYAKQANNTANKSSTSCQIYLKQNLPKILKKKISWYIKIKWTYINHT